MDDDAFTNAFDSWYVPAHVFANMEQVGKWLFRTGSSLPLDFPTLLESLHAVSFLPALDPRPLTRGRSFDTLKMLSCALSTATRKRWESGFIYLRDFISKDNAPTPVGYVITRREPPMAIDVICARFFPEARPFITQAELRSDVMNIYYSDLVARFNNELRRMFDPVQVDDTATSLTTVPVESLATFVSFSSVQADVSSSSSSSSSISLCSVNNTELDPGSVCRKCGQPGHWRMDFPHLDNFRSGNPKGAMADRLKRAISIAKVEILMYTVAASTRSRYRSGWVEWREFCSGLGISPMLAPTVPELDAHLLDFPTRGHKILGVGHSGLVTRYDAIRLVRLVEDCDISKAAFRGRGFLKAVKRTNTVVKKYLLLPNCYRGPKIISPTLIQSQIRNSGLIWRSISFLVGISEIKNLRGNDLVLQSTDDCRALTIRIRKSKTAQ